MPRSQKAHPHRFHALAPALAALIATAPLAAGSPPQEGGDGGTGVTPLAPGAASPSSAPATSEPPAEQIELAGLIRAARDRGNMPAIGAAIVRPDGTITAAVLGARELGKSDVARLDDPWHLGSCGKAITATLIGMLVDQGKLSWETTVAEAFPELAEDIHAGYRAVTLEQLLTGRGGVPEKFPALLWDSVMASTASPPETRMLIVRGILSQPPAAEPGTTFIYSNAAWVIAGAMAERAGGSAFETLMQTMILTPLGMKTAGFGAPGEPGPLLSAPRGHTPARLPVEPGPRADNPPALSPAGTLHCSMEDWGKFIAAQLDGAAGKSTLLRPETWRRIFTPPAGQDYAMGWALRPREWAGGVALTHDGSNTMWYSVAWLAPRKGFAVLVATNIGGDRMGTYVNQAAWDIIQDYLQKTEGRPLTPSGR